MVEVAKPRVLIVDDNEINRYATGRVLRHAGYETIEADCGQEALVKSLTKPDLVLLDVNLPDIDGFQVCRMIRSNPRTSEIPIVHTSATFVSDDDRVQGLDVGADGYLTRPIEPKVLIATIRSCLRARRAEEVLRQRERELQSLADNTPDMIVRFGPDYKHLFTNRAVERLINKRSDEILDKTSREIGMPAELCDRLEAAIDESFATGRSGRLEFGLETAGGVRRFSSTLTVEANAEVERVDRKHADDRLDCTTDDGSMTRCIPSVLLVARDVTEQFHAEQEREKFVTMVEQSRDLIAIYDVDGVPMYMNQAGLNLVGISKPGTCPDAHIRDMFGRDDHDWLDNTFLPEVMTNGYGECEVRLKNSLSGRCPWVNCSLVVRRDAQQNILGYSAVCREVSVQKELEEQLRGVASDLSDSNRRMNEFLATLAHELRNPMAPIRTGMEVIRMAGNDLVTIQNTRAMMERQVHQMIRLIDDLLDLSRITQGKLNLKRAKFDLADVLGSAIDAIRPAIAEAGHTLTTRFPARPIVLDGDPNRLAQVFSNILNNACKYTKENGVIEVTASRRGEEAIVSIKDNGLGIPESMQQRIFEMFTQIDRSIEQGYTGLGIGLTLVKRIVEMHSGSVSVISAGANLGSEFIIRLPCAAIEGHSDPLPHHARSNNVRHRVLVVDDNRDSATLLGLVLKVLGNDIHLAHDGIEAVRVAEEYHPTVILMDLGMPKMNGYEAARLIRQQSWGSQIVLVALTGWGQDEDKARTQDAGFDYHLTKPAEPSAIQQLLNTIGS